VTLQLPYWTLGVGCSIFIQFNPSIVLELSDKA